ncbi:AraC family transcriptional regulator [Sinorhizobium numidicum]|uniref:AraC family transcriptional regulator n=1 Tax=Sinorhizobium numidicum TaxID=680248 RepID=A0ABY8CQQ0_9HYPH|nr:AraC family transcriptional regulator [Sinorhizobium numidicum]WEX74980.1 AraC family transcriptional regulator [Sinorhizobium numidicum]WEX80974.1 AraC family transcriptional regulator [Sinorhizobium numidicum]
MSDRSTESDQGDDPTEGPPSERPPHLERRRWPRQPGGQPAPHTASSPALAPLRFSTHERAPAEQFEAWRSHIAPLVDVILPEGKSPDDGFPAHHTAWHLGNLLIVQQRTPAHSYIRSQAMLRLSPIDHWYVELIRSGRTWTEVDRHVAENEPGKLVFRSLGYPSRGRATDLDAILLFMPYDLLADDAAVLEAANNSVLSGNLANLLINYVSGTEANLDVLTAEELPKIVHTIRDMVVACASAAAGPSSIGTPTNRGMMERAHRYIHRNLHSPDLTPEAVSRALGISRTRLYQLFGASGGVLNYIRKRRLLAAYADLSDPTNNRPISEIAEAAGFDLAANFTRAFSHEFGCSPREVRKAAIAERPVPSAPQVARPIGSTFADWLTTLGL